MPCPEPERWSELADPARRDDLEVHLDSCEDCRELVAALARIAAPADATPAPELATRGARIGRYVVEGPLGAGGMGVVLAAHDPPLDRTVALKLVRVVDRSARAIASARTRLLEEARAMARLAHPNVVAIYEVVAEGDELFIAMERVDGPDLATWLAEAPRSSTERLRAVIGAGRGIAAAHAAGLVHRDIKPANILIGSDGRARVTDLGLAAAIADVDGATVEGSAPGASRAVGTPGYIAPEVAAGARADARADQYAFAVTAWQALFGKRPDGEPTERGRVARVLARALAPRPADRFDSMDALVDQLEHAARPRWPRFTVAAFALAALALGIGWWRERERAAANDCSGDATLGGAWTAGARNTLGAALRARDKSPSATLSTRAIELVDARARAWSTAVSDVCTARSRGTLSRELADLRGACLEQQRRELAAVLAAIADTTSASRALAAVADVATVAACSAAAPATTAPRARPASPELTEIGALRAAGKYDAAKAKLVALAAHVPGDDRSLAATIAYRRADLEMRTGASEAALPFAYDAVATAEAAHDDATRMRAMFVLLQVLDDLGRANEAQSLAPLVEAAAAREPLTDGERAVLENSLGNVLHTAGKYGDAERHYRAALAASEREYGGLPAPEVAGALDSVGSVLHNEGKVADAKDFEQRSLAMFEHTVGPDHPDTAIPLTGLGTLALEDGHLDEAAQLFERVIAIRTAALGPDHAYLCEPISMLGRIELERGHVDRALELQRRALAIAEHGFGANHPLVAAAELHIAEILDDRGDHTEARRLAEASVAIWDASGTALPEAYDARFLLARLAWPGDHTRARALAEAARVGYAALAPPYDKTATTIAAWLAAHR